MNDLLFKRLSDCNIELNIIFEKLKYDNKADSLFIYSSHIEDLGTPYSDFDIYIICNKMPHSNDIISYDNYSIQQIIFNSVLFDVEYWTIETINQLLKNINSNNYNFNSSELKLLHRLSVAELFGNNILGKEIKASIYKSKLNQHVINYYHIQANSFLEDAIYLYNSGDFTCSASCAYKALDSAIGLLNSKNSKTNLKGKWISKLFLDDDINSNYLKNQYMYFQFELNHPNINIEKFLEEKIEFIQEILSNTIFNKEEKIKL